MRLHDRLSVLDLCARIARMRSRIGRALRHERKYATVGRNPARYQSVRARIRCELEDATPCLRLHAPANDSAYDSVA